MIAALLALILQPESASVERADARALEAIESSRLVAPLAKCLRRRVAAHEVAPGQVGSETAARNFAVSMMAPCGAAEVQASLIAAMRSADPGLTSDEGLRRAGALLGTVLSEAAMQATRHFRVAPMQVRIVHCPRKTKPQPEECREQPAPAVDPIEIPYQANAFYIYRRCVMDRFDVAMRTVRNIEEARQAHLDSVAACRDVRAVQLARALEQVTDRKIYGSRAKAQAMALLAFDRFDREFNMEWDTPSPTSEINDTERAN